PPVDLETVARGKDDGTPIGRVLPIPPSGWLVWSEDERLPHHYRCPVVGHSDDVEGQLEEHSRPRLRDTPPWRPNRGAVESVASPAVWDWTAVLRRPGAEPPRARATIGDAWAHMILRAELMAISWETSHAGIRLAPPHALMRLLLRYEAVVRLGWSALFAT